MSPNTTKLEQSEAVELGEVNANGINRRDLGGNNSTENIVDDFFSE